MVLLGFVLRHCKMCVFVSGGFYSLTHKQELLVDEQLMYV